MISQPEVTIKQGDTGPSIKAILKGFDGIAQDLTGAQVRFNLVNAANSKDVRIDHGVVDITTAVNGEVEYVWEAGDTDIAGEYYGEFEATLADNTILTFPNRKPILVHIIPQLA